MNLLVRILVNAVIVLVLAWLLPGVEVSGFGAAIIVAVVLGLLNALLKPLLIILTIPITILTLGLFLLVINAIIILITDSLIGGFWVSNFWWALLFSLLLSILNSAFADKNKAVD